MATIRKEMDEHLTEARAEGERHEREAIDALRTELDEKLSALKNDRDSTVAALEAKGQRELGEAHDKLAKLDMDLSALRGELQSLREEKETGDAAHASAAADLERKVADLQAARDDLQAKHQAAAERVTSLESNLAGVREELARTRARMEDRVGARVQGRLQVGSRQAVARAREGRARGGPRPDRGRRGAAPLIHPLRLPPPGHIRLARPEFYG